MTTARTWPTPPSPSRSTTRRRRRLIPSRSRVAPSPAPEPVEGQGYALRFSDCFDVLSRSVWCSNQWWEPTPPLGTQYVEDGVLHLVRRRSDGYPNVTVSSEPCGQADPQVLPARLHGGPDALDTVRGNGPAFWLLSTRHRSTRPSPGWTRRPDPFCPQHGLPVAECFARARRLRGVRKHPVRRSAAPTTSSPAPSTATRATATASRTEYSVVRHGTGLDLSDWHVYAARWTDTTVTYYVDGELQGQ